MIEALQETKKDKCKRGRRRKYQRVHPKIAHNGWILRGYERTVREDEIVVVPRYESPEANARRKQREKENARANTKKAKWQEFAIMLINILDQYEDTTDLQKYFESLPR